MTDSTKTCNSMREDIINSPEVAIRTIGRCQVGISQDADQSVISVPQSAWARGSPYPRIISIGKRPHDTDYWQCKVPSSEYPHFDTPSVKVVQRPRTAPANGNIPLARLCVAHKSKSSFADFSPECTTSVIISFALRVLASSAFLMSVLLVEDIAIRVYGTIPIVKSADRA